MFFSENQYQELFAKVKPFTMTSYERIKALVNSVGYMTVNQIPGDIVECGVWRGGSMMAVILALQQLEVNERDLYLYDTFEGMTKPDPIDVARHADDSSGTVDRGAFAVSVEEVETHILSLGYPRESIKFIKGPVEQTLLNANHREIAILRLDTDWYQSTRVELETLYPSLSKGGVLIIDDYGHWEGAKKATDEYFESHLFKPFFHEIDYTGRLILKP